MTSQSSCFQLPTALPLLIVISGPSGVGKDTVIKRLQERNLPMHFVITATTRAPRAGERDGVNYFFVSPDRFREMIAHGELLEHANVYDDYKGIPKEQVRQALASGKDVILRLDVQGAATVHALCPEAVLIFLTPANEEELISRLKERESESENSLRIRLDTARQEIAHLDEFEYCVVNSQGQLDAAVDAIVSIIQAEHHRVNQRKVCL
ncbi:MAG: guanylate kinase [Anaerolineaceae bacterium]|nr:guanylate kinase [Anaerolineaceae bacterium]